MPNTSVLNKFLKAEECKDGELINFIDPGIIIPREFKNKETNKPETKEVLEITVDYLGMKKTYSPNGTTLKLLNKAWGPNTEKWVGKSARINILPSSNGKDMIIAKPIVADDAVLNAAFDNIK